MNFSIFPVHNYLFIIRDRIKLAVALDRPFVDEPGIYIRPWPRYLLMTSTDGG